MKFPISTMSKAGREDRFFTPPFQTECHTPTMWRAICFTESSNSSAYLTRKMLTNTLVEI